MKIIQWGNIKLYHIIIYVFREAREALLALGYDTVTTDDMVEAICAQVKSLGTQEVVTEQVLSSQNRKIRDYVLSRPPIGLSNRDYMNSTMRCVDDNVFQSHCRLSYN